MAGKMINALFIHMICNVPEVPRTAAMIQNNGCCSSAGVLFRSISCTSNEIDLTENIVKVAAHADTIKGGANRTMPVHLFM